MVRAVFQHFGKFPPNPGLSRLHVSLVHLTISQAYTWSLVANMKYAIAALGLATAAYAQGVTEEIKPKSSAPEGFSSSYDGKFEISVASFAKRDLEVRYPTSHRSPGLH